MGDDCAAWEPAHCCASPARPERAVPPASKATVLAGVGQQAAPPGEVCGFPPSGQVPGRCVAEMAGVCAICQAVKEPRHGSHGPLHCQDHSTGSITKPVMHANWCYLWWCSCLLSVKLLQLGCWCESLGRISGCPVTTFSVLCTLYMTMHRMDTPGVLDLKLSKHESKQVDHTHSLT